MATAARSARPLAALALIGAVFGAPASMNRAQGADLPVDLELVLAVDASRSIDMDEYALQRDGYAAAITHPRVIRAISNGVLGRIALTYMEWSAEFEQATLVDWAVIKDEASARIFAERLKAAPRQFFDATSISGGIDFATAAFAANGFEGTRRVIDISGDGANNRGRPAAAARDAALARNITINGLAIINDRPSRPPWPEPPLDEFYRDHVIGGPGAFLIVIEGFASFAESIRRKLIREIVAPEGARKLARAPTEIR